MNKKVYILGSILIVVVAILVLQEKLSSRQPAEAELKLFPEVSEKNVSAMVIREGTKTISLRKKGDVWNVSNSLKNDEAVAPGQLSPLAADSAKPGSTKEDREYPVDSAAITTALEKVTSLAMSTLISTNPEKQTIFEVDTNKGTVVELLNSSGNSLGIVIIGKSGPDYNSNYVRKQGSNSVYMALGGIKYSFFTDLSRWRDKSIVTFDKATAQGVTLAKNDGSMITIAHSDSGSPWEIIAPIKNPAKTEEVDGILSKLSKLIATDFQDEVLPDSEMGFDKPELGVTISFKNGSSRNIIFGKKNENKKYWVKAEGKQQVFLIGEGTVNQINKKLEDLKGEPLVKAVAADSSVKK